LPTASAGDIPAADGVICRLWRSAETKDAPAFVSLRHTAPQDVPHAAHTSAIFDALDTGGTSGWGPVELPASAFAAPKSGVYWVEYQASWRPKGVATGGRSIWIEVNSATIGTACRSTGAPTAGRIEARRAAEMTMVGLVGVTAPCIGTAHLRLDRGDTVRLVVAQALGADTAIVARLALAYICP
jgi:hypothetical protein